MNEHRRPNIKNMQSSHSVHSDSFTGAYDQVACALATVSCRHGNERSINTRRNGLAFSLSVYWATVTRVQCGHLSLQWSGVIVAKTVRLLDVARKTGKLQFLSATLYRYIYSSSQTVYKFERLTRMDII